MEASPKRGGRTWRVAFGILAIVVSLLWTLWWGLLALVASAFGGDTGGWVVVSVALALGVLLFVVGVSLVRARWPHRWGWVVVAGAMLVPFALPLGSLADDRSEAPVNRAAQREYMERSGQKNVEADCDILWENPDGSERAECIFESSQVYDICFVDIRRKEALVVDKISECLDGAGPR